MEAAGGGKGGGGKKRSRGGSGRGVWNIESRRGLCSAGLRPEGGAAQRLRKKGGVGARLGEGASSRRGGGDAGDPGALWPRAAAARLGSSRPRSQQVPRRARGGGAGAAAARVLAACLAEGRAPPTPGGRELFLRAPALSHRASLHPGGARVRPRAARTKSAAGTQRAGPCRPWPWSPCRRGRGRGRRLAGPLCRGVASGLSPPPEQGCPLSYPPRRLGPGCLRGRRAEVIPRAGRIPSACAGAGVDLEAPTFGKGPGRVVGSPSLPWKAGNSWVSLTRPGTPAEENCLLPPGATGAR